MRFVLELAITTFALAAAPAAAQSASSYKLIVVANDSTVAIDYPSHERCERAAKVAEDETLRRLREAYAESSDPIIRPKLRVLAFCIPWLKS